MTSEERFNEITSFNKELERYESQGVFNDLEHKMEYLVYFGNEPPNTPNTYKKELEDFKIYILKIRQAEINELKAEISTLKEQVDSDIEETVSMLEDLKVSMNKCHPEYAIECVDDLIDYLKEEEEYEKR